MGEYPTWLIDTGFVLPIITFIVGGLWAVGTLIARRIERRLDKQDANIEAIRDTTYALRSEFDRQMGGNSNGIRQELNKQGQELAEVRGRLGLPVER